MTMLVRRHAWSSMLFVVLVLLSISWNLCSSSSVKSMEMWSTVTSKIASRQEQWRQRGTALERKALIIYHIGDIGLASNSLDIATNNLKIFLGAVDKHSKTALTKAFYLFNVVDDYNPLLSLIPVKRANVALLKWNRANSDLETHLRTIQMLGHNVTGQFGTVVFSNQGVRGPLVKRANGEWIDEFNRLLASNNVGLVGPTMSCEVSPHVQTHMFALRTSVIPFILSDMTAKLEAKYKSWQELISSLEVGLTGVVMNAGYNVSSFLYASRGQPYFKQCVKYTGPPNRFDQNPTGWCGVTAEDLLFVKWGGEPMRTPGMVCNDSLSHMENILETLTLSEPRLQLTVPEVMMGGNMYPLFKEYAQEAWIDRHPATAPLSGGKRSKVCFLVRVIKRQHTNLQYDNPNTPLINKDIELLITTLRRQSSPHWQALFYAIDASPEQEEVRRIVEAFADPRLVLAAHYAADKYDPVDAGYGATDRVLREVLSEHPECRWVSVTTSDNAYGSEVVSSVMKEPVEGAAMLINPMDSRRFQEQDMLFQKQFIGQKEVQLEEYCGMIPSLQLTALTYGVRPMPYVGSIDLAAAFFSAEKLAQEKVFFGNFSDWVKHPCIMNTTDPVGYNCLGNRGAHLISHLVQKRLWSYTRLPIAGLRSVVFHGNSPTLCIGAGNVWVDYFEPSQQRCITPKDTLRIEDDPYWSQVYHLPHFFTQGQILGTCLRVKQTPKSLGKKAPTAASKGHIGQRASKGLWWYLQWLRGEPAPSRALLLL